MDLNEYRIGDRLLNTVEAVDYVLAKLLEVENAKIISALFDFEKFDLDVMPLIKKVKIQFYFKLKLSELKALHPQQNKVAVENKRADYYTEIPKKKIIPNSNPIREVSSKPENFERSPNTAYSKPAEMGRRQPTGFIKVIGEAPEWKNAPAEQILLHSKRATYYNSDHTCRNCYSGKAHWRYAESSVGPVMLCSSCKDRLYQKSHGGKSDTIFTVVNRSKKS